MNITQNKKWARSQNALSSKVDSETIILGIESDQYISFEGVGSRIWDLIEEPKTTYEICQLLTEEYDVSIEDCKKESLLFLESLLEKKIVEQV